MDNKNTEISARITEMLNDIAISPNLFASNLGYNRGQTIYDIMNCKSAPSYDFFKRFMFSEYSVTYDIDWLLTGRGIMLKESKKYFSHPLEKDLITLIREKDDKIEKLSRLVGRLEAEIAFSKN